MVFIAVKQNGDIVHHTSLQSMRSMDGLSAAELTVSDEAFEAAGGLVRRINGQLVLGKTLEERTAESATARIAQIDRELAEIDQKKIRSTAEIASAVASGSQPSEIAKSNLNTLEVRASSLRAERAGVLSF
ncbi:hypothetical protein FACS1894164_03980 [Spirochaetia bacterium]|nr:hypothetical protein FACS1894164_03980 [Spirochaetia bacterium]